VDFLSLSSLASFSSSDCLSFLLHAVLDCLKSANVFFDMSILVTFMSANSNCIKNNTMVEQTDLATVYTFLMEQDIEVSVLLNITYNMQQHYQASCYMKLIMFSLTFSISLTFP
jgi:hypothetical protein